MLMRGGVVNINGTATNAHTLFNTATGGSLTILPSDATASTTALDIASGSAYTGAINIGNGASSKNITIGSGAGGTTLIRGGTVNISSNSSATNALFSTSTGGSVSILPSDATVSTTTLNLATGSAYTGNVNIGTGANNTGSVNIGRGTMINVDGDNGSFPTITFSRPITPSYTPSSIISTTLGYTDFPSGTIITTLTTTNQSIASFSIGAGVWDVKTRVRISGVVAAAGNYFRMGLTTSNTSFGVVYGDWNQDNIGGAINIQLSNTFSVNSTTTIYVRGSCGVNGGTTDVCDTIATRIA